MVKSTKRLSRNLVSTNHTKIKQNKQIKPKEQVSTSEWNTGKQMSGNKRNELWTNKGKEIFLPS